MTSKYIVSTLNTYDKNIELKAFNNVNNILTLYLNKIKLLKEENNKQKNIIEKYNNLYNKFIDNFKKYFNIYEKRDDIIDKELKVIKIKIKECRNNTEYFDNLIINSKLYKKFRILYKKKNNNLLSRIITLKLLLINYFNYISYKKKYIGNWAKPVFVEDKEPFKQYPQNIIKSFKKFKKKIKYTEQTKEKIDKCLHNFLKKKNLLFILNIYEINFKKSFIEKKKCSICKSHIEETDIKYLNCCKNAHFHICCIIQWMQDKPNCPLCRNKNFEYYISE